MTARMDFCVSEAVYHGTPGLSSTGMSRILEAPALYRWHADNPTPPNPAFDLGHAVHARVLGVGLGEVIVPAPWSTKVAREQVHAAYDEGLIPLKPKDAAVADAMAAAVMAHEDAGPLLRAPGSSEVSVFWDDETTGVPLRARFDRLLEVPVIVDLKTARSANPAAWGKHCAQFGYHRQAAHYLDALRRARGDVSPRFLHVVVEKEPPFLVSVCELDADAIETGEAEVREAINRYARCMETGSWPGYAPGLHRTSLPAWYRHAGTDDEGEY